MLKPYTFDFFPFAAELYFSACFIEVFHLYLYSSGLKIVLIHEYLHPGGAMERRSMSFSSCVELMVVIQFLPSSMFTAQLRCKNVQEKKSKIKYNCLCCDVFV